MAYNEDQLKQHIKEGKTSPIYVLYGEETYLVRQYAEKLCRRAAGDDELDSFNLHRFDGARAGWDEIEDAAEALPLMAETSCVIVRDYDVSAHADSHDRLLALLKDPNDACVLIFYYDAVAVSAAKNAKWKTFLAAAEEHGTVAKLDRRTPEEIVRMLSAGAARRGCTMRPDVARLLLEWCGNDLHLLLSELDKLSALAGEGEITRELVEKAASRNLESRVFDLSKAILGGQYTRAYAVLNGLFAQKEDPIMINGVLASAWADLYRAKVAGAAGRGAADIAAAYPAYKGKDFRLRNAARDAARLSAVTLRQGLEVLAEADRRLKFTPADNRVVMEETTARLIVLTRQG